MNALVIGAGRGIGLEFVRQYLEDPAYGKVFATFRQSSKSLTHLAATYPEKLVCLQVDITIEADIQEAIATIKQKTMTLNEVIYAVGVLHDGQMQPEKSLRHIQSENLVSYFQVNAIGAVLWAKYLLPLLRGSNPAIFAVISAKVGSIGDNGLGGWYGYRASKAALNMLLKNVSIEWRRVAPNIIVALLHPGTTDTELSKPFQKNVPEGKLFPPEKTVTLLRTVIDNLTPQDNGEFFSWNGDRLPW
ncbi:short-chain dehydrogenase/reductase SDR [[Leptolyngbya] sp. PCC 7376]|uniref:SDR family NAD(P)-dependent oxidoreductase n=1 Tax=[Leptolyngbya] sp. PCC 7376 TaxID=111781 RepID=UPI00029F1670|nr:SDR family NAD(P)-dependent oxidoreductase [[Leptolyngbya] sp. PCC 7376]AFY39579.1 short-chain dehydrogenase/reductase SDR [[Leptolyngbya] sp. PCC 7376]